MLWSLSSARSFGIGTVADERRAAESGEVNGQLEVPGDAEIACGGAGGVDLAFVNLAVADAEGVESAKPSALRHRRGRVRVEPTAEEDDGSFERSNPPGIRTPDVLVHLQLQPYRQAIGQNPRGRSLPARTPCTGEIESRRNGPRARGAG